MKRTRETELMIAALKNHGFPETSELRNAVGEGLKAIRREKYEERQAQKNRRFIFPEDTVYDMVFDALDESLQELRKEYGMEED